MSNAGKALALSIAMWGVIICVVSGQWAGATAMLAIAWLIAGTWL